MNDPFIDRYVEPVDPYEVSESLRFDLNGYDLGTPKRGKFVFASVDKCGTDLMLEWPDIKWWDDCWRK